MVAEAPKPFEDDGEMPDDALPPEQARALAALLAEPTIARAATASGVSERTIYRWLDERAFSAAFRKARRETFKQAVSMTQKYTPMAIQTLAKVMTDAGAPFASRVAAANAMLKFSRESIELDDLAHRVEELETNSAKEERSERGRGR